MYDHDGPQINNNISIIIMKTQDTTNSQAKSVADQRHASVFSG